MANEVCYRTLGLDQPWSLATYRSVGGYESWQKILAGQLKRLIR
jgi:NADH-quinone oxidoreductase subunit F